jgi:radical SAM superfamily enzyme YgiQ (UPF0313 family)
MYFATVSNYGKNMIDDGDFLTIPYGLLSLGAQTRRAGHDVLTLNLSNFPWRDIELLISHIPGDLFGLSCHVSNRRGLALLAKLIRKVHPQAHIVCGGPFVTALPGETLTHYQAIDTVVIGEGEETFLELIGRLERGEATAGLAGTAWRSGGRVHFGPPRQRITDLDTLASPLDYFPTKTLITSRGCPGECTFCGSKAMWGKELTFHSVDYVLDMLQKAVNHYGQKIIVFKDDTFTAHRDRALAICRGIIRLKLNFVWSCDTRVNALNEEVLYFMRLAGCQRLSLGVESGSPLILKNIKKHISPELVLEVTRLAKKYGFQIRYYMIAGNRGETVETFQQSLDFLQEAQPHETIMYPLHIYPGTADFDILKAQGLVPEIFFTEDFETLAKFPGRPLDNRQLRRLYKKYHDSLAVSHYSLEELKTILRRLPHHPGVHMDLAGAYCRQGDYDAAEKHLQLALELNYPLEGQALNYFACIAAAKQDYSAVMINLIKAFRAFPHEVVGLNLKLLRDWHKEGGPQSGRPLTLVAHNLFERHFMLEQPQKPGPIRLHSRQSDKIYNLGDDYGIEYHQVKPLDIQY